MNPECKNCTILPTPLLHKEKQAASVAYFRPPLHGCCMFAIVLNMNVMLQTLFLPSGRKNIKEEKEPSAYAL